MLQYLSHYNHAHAQTYAQSAIAAVAATATAAAAAKNTILDIEQCNVMHYVTFRVMMPLHSFRLLEILKSTNTISKPKHLKNNKM